MKKQVLTATLWAMAFVCSAQAQSTTPSVPAEERKTPAQWLEVIKAQNIECRKYEEAHPDETKLLYGATQSSPLLPKDQLEHWPAQYKEGYKYYQAWWAAEGEAEFNKWRHDRFPILADKHYLILHAVAMGLYQAQDMKLKENKDLATYGDAIVKRGKQLFLKGCNGDGLSQAELAELRLFAMYYGQIHAQPPNLLPTYLGWMKSDQMALGSTAPDFTLPRMEEILALPTYSDQSPFDEMNLFRPAILIGELQIMDGYTAVPRPRKNSFLLRAKPYENRFKDPVTLSSFRGKKPVLLMFEDACDTWTWSGEVAPLWEPLYQTINDRVEIFFVHTTVTDQIMPGTPNSNGAIPGLRSLRPVSFEARARTAKMCYMNFPTLSIPYLLDDLSQHVMNAYESGGGESSTVLVDKQGKISFSIWQRPECNDYMWKDTASDNFYSLVSRHHRVMNLVECNLKALLDAGGVWNKDMKPIIPDWRMPAYLEQAVVSEVNAQAGLVTVLDKNKKPITIAVDGQSRILLGGAHNTIADVKAGQTLSICYQKDSTSSSGWMARLIANGDTWYPFWYPGATWVPATVQSVDVNQGTIQAKMTLRVQGCKGAEFWKNPSPEMVAAFGDAATSIPRAFKHVADHTGQVLTLHFDRATEVFINGMIAKMSDLKSGDQLGIELPNDFKAENVWPHFVRVYRF